MLSSIADYAWRLQAQLESGAAANKRGRQECNDLASLSNDVKKARSEAMTEVCANERGRATCIA